MSGSSAASGSQFPRGACVTLFTGRRPATKESGSGAGFALALVCWLSCWAFLFFKPGGLLQLFRFYAVLHQLVVVSRRSRREETHFVSSGPSSWSQCRRNAWRLSMNCQSTLQKKRRHAAALHIRRGSHPFGPSGRPQETHSYFF